MTRAKTQWTPGPWHAKPFCSPANTWYIETDGRAVITGGSHQLLAHDAHLIAAAPELFEALETWREFWDTMPKGQMGKLSFNVGLFNEGFLKMERALAKAKQAATPTGQKETK